MQCLVFFCFIIMGVYTLPLSKAASLAKDASLVLQWEVSHPRNTDQISLVFHQKEVELIANTSSYQTGKVIRLGRFKMAINPSALKLKKQIQVYYNNLKQTVPLSELIKDPRVQSPEASHAPVLRILDETLHYKHPHFNVLARVLHTAWDNAWVCVECAVYTKTKKGILRTVKKVKARGKKHGKAQHTSVKTMVSKKLFQCIPRGSGKEECVDPQFGIFEI